MSDPPTSATPRLAENRKLQASRRNEQLKLTAAALDRLSTVTLAGAVLTPIVQHQSLIAWQISLWAAGALMLHGMAQVMLVNLREEV